MTPVEKLTADIAYELQEEMRLDADLLAAENEERQARGADGDIDAGTDLLLKKKCKVDFIKGRIDKVRDQRRLKIAALRDAEANAFESEAARLRTQAADMLSRFTKAWNECARIQELAEPAESIVRRFEGVSVKWTAQADSLVQRAAQARRGAPAKRNSLEFTGSLSGFLALVSEDARKDSLVLVPALYCVRAWAAGVENRGELTQAHSDWPMLAPRSKWNQLEKIYHLEFTGNDIDPTRSTIKVGQRHLPEPPAEPQRVESEAIA